MDKIKHNKELSLTHKSNVCKFEFIEKNGESFVRYGTMKYEEWYNDQTYRHELKVYPNEWEQKPKKIKKHYKIINFNQKLLKILNHYGNVPQLVQSIQEMSELTKEITNMFFALHKFNIKEIEINEVGLLDELADVYIMLGQLKLMFEISEFKLGEKIDEKLERQIERINKEEYGK